jgi:hypothetical protein
MGTASLSCLFLFVERERIEGGLRKQRTFALERSLLLSDARSNMLRYPQETSSPRIEISSLSFENSYDHREQIIVPEILLLHLPRSQHVRYLHDPPMIFLPPLKNSHDPTTPRASASFGYYHYQTAISWGLGGPRTRTSDCHQSTASVTNQAPPTNSPRGTRTIATPVAFEIPQPPRPL